MHLASPRCGIQPGWWSGPTTNPSLPFPTMARSPSQVFAGAARSLRTAAASEPGLTNRRCGAESRSGCYSLGQTMFVSSQKGSGAAAR